MGMGSDPYFHLKRRYPQIQVGQWETMGKWEGKEWKNQEQL